MNIGTNKTKVSTFMVTLTVFKLNFIESSSDNACPPSNVSIGKRLNTPKTKLTANSVFEKKLKTKAATKLNNGPLTVIRKSVISD